MPAVSKHQRRAAAIALHHPDQLYARNSSLAKMSMVELHRMARTPERGLPSRVKVKKHG